MTPFGLFCYVLAGGAAVLVLSASVLVVFLLLYGWAVKANRERPDDVRLPGD